MHLWRGFSFGCGGPAESLAAGRSNVVAQRAGIFFNGLGTQAFPEAVEQEDLRDRKPPSEPSMPTEQIREHPRNRVQIRVRSLPSGPVAMSGKRAGRGRNAARLSCDTSLDSRCGRFRSRPPPATDSGPARDSLPVTARRHRGAPGAHAGPRRTRRRKDVLPHRAHPVPHRAARDRPDAHLRLHVHQQGR